jgi:hypothetical protein
MKIKNKAIINNNKRYLLIKKIIFIQIITSIIILNVNANENFQEKQLIIDIQDEAYEVTNISVSVYTFENNTPIYQIDSIINFNNKSYNITIENPEILIETPQVNKDTLYEITATKIGYIKANTYILILDDKIENKSQIIITILDNDFIIDGNSYFSVLITNENGIIIPDVKIAIQNYIGKDSISFTDDNGRAQILAPNNREEIIILAQKEGYIEDTEKIWINRNPELLERLIENPYFIITISIIILIFSILIVKIRKQKFNYKQKYKECNDSKKNSKMSKNNLKKINKVEKSNSIKDAKIEEIRITKKIFNNRIELIDSKKENLKKHSNNLYKNIENKNWFEGINDIRLKIDNLTNNNNINNENRWFEGKENIQKKIDEKLKNKKN